MVTKVKPMNGSKLLSLPPEVISLVLEQCDVEELRSVYSSCKFLKAQADLPLKYRRVDLSIHTRGRVEVYQHWTDTMVSRWCDWWPPENLVQDLAVRQDKFTANVLSHPSTGKLTHHLTWTVCANNKSAPTNEQLPSSPNIWTVCTRMQNVISLDLAFMCGTERYESLRNPPILDFPALNNLRLGGVIHPCVVRAILDATRLDRLESLALDNLQDPGESNGQSPWIKAPQRPLPWDVVENDDTRLPGTMRRVLPTLVGKCAALKHFYYRKPGYVRRHLGQYNKPLEKDEQCYVEVAQFLLSVVSTLQTFHFEQSVDQSLVKRFQNGTIESTWIHNCVSQFGPRSQQITPKDEFFVKHILSVLSRPHWDCLKQLKVIGVGRWNGKPAISRYRQQRLQESLGKAVDISFEEWTERPCESYNRID